MLLWLSSDWAEESVQRGWSCSGADRRPSGVAGQRRVCVSRWAWHLHRRRSSHRGGVGRRDPLRDDETAPRLGWQWPLSVCLPTLVCRVTLCHTILPPLGLSCDRQFTRNTNVLQLYEWQLIIYVANPAEVSAACWHCYYNSPTHLCSKLNCIGPQMTNHIASFVPSS